MKIFNREQIYNADKETISKSSITSYQLMERAAGKAFERIKEGVNPKRKIHIFCGVGNNGGDGLVLARRLVEEGYDVLTYVIAYIDKRSDDFKKAQKNLEQNGSSPEILKEDSKLPELSDDGIIIDAIFGIGYNRPADNWIQELFDHINKSAAFTIAIDIPSGLYLDTIPGPDEHPVKADLLLTFQVPKLVFFLPETGKFIKNWELLDIGLDAECIAEMPTDYFLIDSAEAKKYFRNREKYTHKGTYGHGLIVGGSYGKIGAVILSAKACLKSGSGLVSAYVPHFAMPILQSSLPEVMVLTDRHQGNYLEEIAIDLKADAIGIGMGMDTGPITLKAFKAFLESNKAPLVVDADALNCLAKKPELLNLLPEKSVLTPHPKELERLIGSWKDDFDKLEKAKTFAEKYDVVLVIKGANTMCIYDHQCYVNNTGNPGMATGGTGDALTGIITGLIAQGYDTLDAAIFGVYLHGSAGDHAVTAQGYEAMTAGDLVDYLGKAYLDFYE